MLWLVKWFLAFLWLAFGVLSVIAFFAILFTGLEAQPQPGRATYGTGTGRDRLDCEPWRGQAITFAGQLLQAGEAEREAEEGAQRELGAT
jgi:hypothetical protein